MLPVRAASPTDSGFVNIDLCSKPYFPAVDVPLGPPEPSQPVRIPMKGSSSEANKVYTNATVRPVTKSFELTVTLMEPVGASTASTVSAATVAAPYKQRANRPGKVGEVSLEKNVCAKVKIGSKRHSSEDKPMKGKSVNLFCR